MGFKNTSGEDAKQAYDNGTLFVDIREQLEYDEIRIPGSTLIPMSQMNQRWEEIPKDKEVVLYCRTGSRSMYLIQQLQQMGFENLINLEGGIVKWYQFNYPVEQG